MAKTLRVLFAGRSKDALKQLVDGLAGASEIACSTCLTGEGQADVLTGLNPRPDVLVLRYEAGNLSELAALADLSPNSRPALIVVGPPGHADAIRLAMRSGAKDFLADPVKPEDLIAAVNALRDEVIGERGGAQGAEMTVTLGAAGGVGTSLIACNLACALTTEVKAPTLLLDLDLNAAPLASFLDVAPERGLPSAVAEVEYLDEHALGGYVTKHRSGLHLMGAPSRSLVSVRDVDLTRFGILMDLLGANYRHIVADASHTLDDLSVVMLRRATTVVLVMQQSVVQLRKAARMTVTLSDQIGVPAERILIVVNRRIKHSTVALDDIRRTLGRETLPVVPNDYKAALSSIDSGVPLLQLDRSSSLSKAIIDLQRQIVGGQPAARPSLLRRALPIFSGD